MGLKSIGPIATAILAAYLIYLFVKDRLQAGQARNWPSAEGTILDGAPHGVPGSGGDIWYAKMRFSFHVDGGYYGNTFEVRMADEDAAQQYVRAHLGKTVTVRYKPGDPDTVRVTLE